MTSINEGNLSQEEESKDTPSSLEYRLDENNWELLETHLVNKDILKFDWDKRWLRGEEYFYILANMQKYIKAFGLETFTMKSHPDSIYVEP